jgi:DNA anti-recombination protein RmuC
MAQMNIEELGVKVEMLAGSIEDLAAITKNGFERVDKQFDEFRAEVNERFDKVDSKIEGIEFKKLEEEKRIGVLEDQMKVVSRKLGFA